MNKGSRKVDNKLDLTSKETKILSKRGNKNIKKTKQNLSIKTPGNQYS